MCRRTRDGSQGEREVLSSPLSNPIPPLLLPTLLPLSSQPYSPSLPQVGTKNRSVGATAMNQDSSRSHSIFTITIECVSKDIGVSSSRSHSVLAITIESVLVRQLYATPPSPLASPDLPPTPPSPQASPHLPPTPPSPPCRPHRQSGPRGGHGRAHQTGQAQSGRPGRLGAPVQDGGDGHAAQGGHQDQPVAVCARQRHQVGPGTTSRPRSPSLVLR